MSDQFLPVRSSTHNTARPAMSTMPGMDTAGTDLPASSGSPLWFSATNWLGTVGVALAAIFWTYGYSPNASRKSAALSRWVT